MIAATAQLETVIEAGALLTEVASGYMKGDTVTVRAVLAWPSADGGRVLSNSLEISVFVPEG